MYVLFRERTSKGQQVYADQCCYWAMNLTEFHCSRTKGIAMCDAEPYTFGFIRLN